MTSSSTTARPPGSGCAQPLLALENVGKSFGDVQVLRAVSLSMARGEVLVVVGPSGGGKSTLCRTINRLEPIDSGRILFDGRPLPAEGRELARHRADVGMVFQSFNLFAHKTVLQNVTLGPVNVRKTPKAQAEAQAMDLLGRVGIQSQAHKHPAQLSGGQQQRAAIARALAMRPRLMLFKQADDLKGKKVCSGQGSASGDRIEELYGSAVNLIRLPGYGDCVNQLLGGQVQAVTTDNTILAGFAAQSQNQGKLKVVGTFFSNEIYGIGLKKGDTKGVTAVDGALRTMFQDGQWRTALSKNLPQVPAETAPAIGKFDIPFQQ